MADTGLIYSQNFDPSKLDPALQGAVPAAPTFQAPQMKAETYTPVTRTVNAPTETVSGQFNTLTASDNPLMRMARTRSDQEANRRGLINSSIAIGASDVAAYQAALPIAQDDAGIYGTASRENQAATNKATEFNANAANQASQVNVSSTSEANKMAQNTWATQADIGLRGTELSSRERLSANEIAARQDVANKELAGQTYRAELEAATRTNTAALDAALRANIATLDANTKMDLAGIESQYKSAMQASASASEVFKQAVLNLTTIANSKDMAPEAKDAATKNQLLLLQNGMRVVGALGNLDLENLLTFADTTVAPAPAITPPAAAPVPTEPTPAAPVAAAPVAAAPVAAAPASAGTLPGGLIATPVPAAPAAPVPPNNGYYDNSGNSGYYDSFGIWRSYSDASTG